MSICELLGCLVLATFLQGKVGIIYWYHVFKIEQNIISGKRLPDTEGDECRAGVSILIFNPSTTFYKINKTRDIKYHKNLKVSCKFQNPWKRDYSSLLLWMWE